jgi:hypothetical protein
MRARYNKGVVGNGGVHRPPSLETGRMESLFIPNSSAVEKVTTHQVGVVDRNIQCKLTL